MKSNAGAMAAVAAGLLISGVATGQGSAGRQDPGPVSDELVTKAAACLVSQKWVQESLEAAGIQFGPKRTTVVRPLGGSIPGTSPTDRDQVSVAFYSSDDRRAALLFVRLLPDQTLELVHCGYRLSRDAGRWRTEDGQGGLATYAAVSRYVQSLDDRRAVKLTVVPSMSGCRLPRAAVHPPAAARSRHTRHKHFLYRDRRRARVASSS